MCMLSCVAQLSTIGVGKNVAVDRVLELLRAEREYVQLHRDTTAPSLEHCGPWCQNCRLTLLAFLGTGI